MATPLLSPVAAPAATPQRTGGLLPAAVPGDENSGWLHGVMEWPESALGWELSQDCSTEKISVGNQAGGQRPLSGIPYLIRTQVFCPRPHIAAMAERVRRRLDVITPRAIARELMLGEITQADPYGLSDSYDWLNTSPGAGEYVNPYLIDTVGTELASIADPLAAFGAVEAAVAARVISGPVYIHAPLSLVMEVGASLIARGDLLLTPTGGIVIADWGYPEDDPPFIYGTGPVQVWTGAIEVDAEPGEVLDRETNEIIVYASRPALALFDIQTLVSVEVTAP